MYGIYTTVIVLHKWLSRLIFTWPSSLQAKAQFADSGETKVLEPEDVARAVVYATSQPEYVAVNEILIEPRQAPIS